MVVLPALEDGLTSVRAFNELRPVRAATGQNKDEDFCTRFDIVERALTA